MSCGDVGCVLLAAGTSSRMGKNKLFLEIDSETVLRRAVRTAVAAGLDPVLVALGHERDRARQDAGERTTSHAERDHRVVAALVAGCRLDQAERLADHRSAGEQLALL